MSFPGNNYAPPNVYTQTFFENPIATTIESLKIPVFIGEGNEFLFQENLELVRGSSASVDQEVVQEDQTGRAVVDILASGEVILGSFDGNRTRFQVRNYPIVSGDGTGTTTTDRSAVSVTVNGQPIVVLSLDGTNGIVELAQAPKAGDLVRATYFFNRTDTLITDDVSAQVTSENALIQGRIGVDVGASETFDFNSTNNELILTVDQEAEQTFVIPLGAGGVASYTPSQLVSFINGANIGTLTGSTFVNNFGKTAVALNADFDIVVGSGSANQILGFASGESSARNRVFATFQGPIVDGSNGGVTTTDPADVTVKVDGIQVIPVAVDGNTRLVTLGFAPKAGSIVSIQYFFNTYQDTFDYLANIGVTEVLRCGITPDRKDFFNKADFVLKDDKILWGTASLISSGVHTAGKEFFGSNQITSTLVDNKTFLSECTPVVNATAIPPEESRTNFVLPFQPTTGNGRNSPLGTSLFQTISNSRIDLPTNRPDLVTAYWGYSVQEALDRGPVEVLKVESDTSTITLADAVPVGATVYATFYYNLLTDSEYTLTTVLADVAGIGTYSITDGSGSDVLDPSFDNSTKSANLLGITLEFPSGSELSPDVHFESVAGSDFSGPVEETVTVTFASTPDSPARFSTPGADPYFPIDGSSDRIRIRVDNSDLVTGAAGIDLADVTGSGAGFMASLLSDEIVYDASTGGLTYTLDATNNQVDLLVDNIQISSTVTAGAGLTIADFVSAINTAAKAGGSAAPQYAGSTQFNASYTVTVSEYDNLTLHYTGDVTGASGNQIITLTPGTYGTASLLAAEIDTQLATINGGGGLNATVTCAADASGRMVFTLARAGADASGFLEFIDDAAPAEDFAIVAGIDTDAATAGGQMKLLDGDIARRYTVGAGPLLYDRMILRNRILPGGSGSMSHHHALGQTNLLVQGASEKAGLSAAAYGLAGYKGSVSPATLKGDIGFSGGQITGAANATDSQPAVTFYDGTGVNAQNNEFSFTLDGINVVVTFTASASGTSTAVGPESEAGTVIRQIQDALAALPGAPFGNLAAVQAAGIIRQEGAGFRITSTLSNTTSGVVIGEGSANSDLGFGDGETALKVDVQAAHLASSLMNHAQATVGTMLLTYATPAATYFAGEALAGILVDSVNNEYLYLQSLAVGTGSVIEWSTSSADDILLAGTGLLVTSGDGDVGEAGQSGFYVTSSNPNGSGTKNDSVFNSGTGQDGLVGKTYRDLVTGLTFTILPRQGGLGYPDTGNFRFEVKKVITTDANLPIRALPGVELIVSNTFNVGTGDTAIVETFERGGQEPSVGDLYYISYIYTKQDFSTALYTKLSSIEAAYGEVSPNNPVSMASFLAILNGAVLLAIKQVPKEEGSQFASTESYRDAVDDLATPLPGGIKPDILHPLKGDSLDFFQYITLHADIQSSIRYRSERTVNAGFASGTSIKDAQNTARAISGERFRIVYPDVALMNLTDALGNTREVLIDGPQIAAMLTGNVVSPNLDVATPWTGRNLTGLTQLARQLDAVEQNQLAQSGITVLEDRTPFVRVRQGLTTNMANIFSRLPTITLIADEVQRQSRSALEPFIGIKFLPGIVSQIEGRLGKTLQVLQQEQIIAAYTGVRANIAADDPTTAEVEAYYAPVFPLLYILITFHLRASLEP